MANKETKKENKSKKNTKAKDTATTEPKVQSVMEGKSVQPVTMEELIKPLEGQTAQTDIVETANDTTAENVVDTPVVENIQEEVVVEAPVVEKVEEVVEKPKKEATKQDRIAINRLTGYNWNGQVYDY